MTMSDAKTVRPRGATRAASANVTNDVILALVEQNKALVEAVVQLTAMRPNVIPPSYGEPMLIPGVPEEVEDARFAHNAGLINDSELESVLRRAGFPGSSIDLV